jgi:putative ABC transport system ATP-binding protein
MNISATPDLIVRLRGLKKTFGQGAAAVHALRGVDLDVAPNRLAMLVGPSGCGKTTLLSVISGLLNPTSGQAEVCGIDWSHLAEDEKTRYRGELIGYVFQQFRLIPTLPAVLNVAVTLLARGVKRRGAVDRAAAALQNVGLGDRLGAMPSELSGGMQQRVAVARALAGEPRLLVCDEPTGNLDRQTSQAVMELIHAVSRGKDERGRPRSVMLVTHDETLLRFADVVYEMEDGQLRCPPVKPQLKPPRTSISQSA